MDHITRCPNCATAFRVTDEQLAACMGKVRCGRCSFTFNARQSLVVQAPKQEETPPQPIPVTLPPAQEPESEAETSATPVAQETDFEPPFPDLVMVPAAPSAPVEIIITPAKSEPELPAEPAEFHAEPEEHHTPSVADLYAEALKDAPVESSTPPADQWTAQDEDDAPDTLMVTTEVNEDENRPSAPGIYRPIALPEDEALFAPIEKPRHARIWTFLALLAGLALIAQLLFAYRVNIAMEFPALQPRFAKLCDTLGCDMPLPGKMERLRLEWSELTYIPDHPTLIQLAATLRNLADYEQALPMLELTLTDEQERIVARRVFRPSEYLANTDKTRRSLPSHDELRAFLQLETGQLHSTGYSLYWFYE